MAAIEVLAGCEKGLSVSALAQQLQLSDPLVSRILTTLAEAGYVSRATGDDRYRLTFRLASVARVHMDACHFASVVQPVLDRLAADTRQWVGLIAFYGDKAYCVASASGNPVFRFCLFRDPAVPVHATAAGKAWLAALPEEEALRIVASTTLEPFTPLTITTIAGLREELQRINERGFATSIDEFVAGISAVARAVHIPDCAAAAVMAIGLTPEFGPERILELDARLRSAADELAAQWPAAAHPQQRHG